MSQEALRGLFVGIPALLFSLSVHEFAHAWVATKLGDPTPANQGRLTLSPISHIDIIGTLVFPIVLMLANAPVFGWAKPVEFSPSHFTRRLSMWQGTALTACAGPLSNVLLATICALILRFGLQMGLPQDSFAISLLVVMFQLNIILAAFNILPLPPLDGGHLIPERFHALRSFLATYSFLLFLAIFFIDIPGFGTLGSYLIRPIVSFLTYILRAITGL